ncbi:MaoC family dehydratase [Rhodococcus opacus]|nr:MaoC family dehydratase [Rhodococcus opacus]
MHLFDGVDEFEKAVGAHLGYSEWHTVTQDQINLFADATGDHQWIHVDPARAAAGPFGDTIAHGYLTLSLAPKLAAGVYRVGGLSMGINYGTNTVRFITPVRVGSRLRAGVELLGVAKSTHGVRATTRIAVELEGSDKPACVAEMVSLLVA